MKKWVSVLSVAACMAVFNPMVAAAPLPMLQLDFPVLAVGEVGEVRVQVPPHDGWGGSQVYTFYMKRQFDEYDPRYRILRAACPPGFRSRNFNETEADCARMTSGAHPAFEITLQIKNVGAEDGETLLRSALLSSINGSGNTWAPLRLYGVK